MYVDFKMCVDFKHPKKEVNLTARFKDRNSHLGSYFYDNDK